MVNSWFLRNFGLQPYHLIQKEMEDWAESGSPSEIWVGEHPLVISKGVRAKRLQDNYNYPVCQSSRGGLLSLHLPGQLVFYPLYRFKTNFDVQRFVFLLEEMMICYLSQLQIQSYRCLGTPGIYTKFGKIASLGLRTRRGGTIHGLSFNLCCPLRPFSFIESCGQKNMSITNLAAHGIFPMISSVKNTFAEIFLQLLFEEFGA